MWLYTEKALRNLDESLKKQPQLKITNPKYLIYAPPLKLTLNFNFILGKMSWDLSSSYYNCFQFYPQLLAPGCYDRQKENEVKNSSCPPLTAALVWHGSDGLAGKLVGQANSNDAD